MAIRLLDGGNAPEKVEAALVYRGSTKEAARELVHGILSGNIKSPPGVSDEHDPTDWATLPCSILLALGLLALIGTVAVAHASKVIHFGWLIAGLLISGTGLERLLGPKRRRLSITLGVILAVLATAAASFV